MSQSIRDFERSFNSTADLSATKHLIVAVDTLNENSVVVATSATDPIVGVLQNKPKAGQSALVRFIGTTKVVSAGVIASGAYVTSNATGKAVATAVIGNQVIGRALESAVAGDVIEVLLSVSTV